MIRAVLLALVAFAAVLQAQPRRVLYVTHSAGYRHDSIEVSRQVLQTLSPQLEITATEDLSTISENSLRNYHAVFFFTSGELALNSAQRAALLNFVRSGGGFGGAHSATDTLYSWPEYGELIGAYFDGHPWVQPVRIDIEDPDHPATAHLKPAFTITDEIYQFRSFTRDRVRVLMTLDTGSVSLSAPGAQTGTTDFPLAWVRPFGSGRVFYTALGHFADTWRDARFAQMLQGALLWLTGQVPGEATSRSATITPTVATSANAASGEPRDRISGASFVSIYGTNLTSGSAMAGNLGQSLAGTSVTVGGVPARLVYASPAQLNILVPRGLAAGSTVIQVSVRGVTTTGSRPVEIVPAAPGCFAITQNGRTATVWATGLGTAAVSAMVGGRDAQVLYAGPSMEFEGLDQINLAIPDELAAGTHGVQVAVRGNAPFCAQALQIIRAALPPPGIREN